MAPKRLPPELLFEIVPCVPIEDAIPKNVMSSCRLLRNLLHQRVIKWLEMSKRIFALEKELAETKNTLAATRAELAATKEELAATRNALVANMKEFEDMRHRVKNFCDKTADDFAVKMQMFGKEIAHAPLFPALFSKPSIPQLTGHDHCSTSGLTVAKVPPMVPPRTVTLTKQSHQTIDRRPYSAASRPALANTKINFRAVTKNSIVLSWESQFDKEIRHYVVAKLSDGKWINVSKKFLHYEKFLYETKITELKPNTKYCFKIQTLGDNGEKKASFGRFEVVTLPR